MTSSFRPNLNRIDESELSNYKKKKEKKLKVSFYSLNFSLSQFNEFLWPIFFLINFYLFWNFK